MSLSIDLHAHSNFSDGELSPRDLIDAAKQAAIDMFALTDHDTVAGLAEAATRAREVGLHFICGAELSVVWNHHDLHVIALNIDPTNKTLLAGLQQQHDKRAARAEKIAEGLALMGVANALEGARAIANNHNIGRPHFAKFLIDNGYASDFKQAFSNYLRAGRPGYVKTAWASLEEAVSWITAAGGVAVLAHPGRYKLTSTQLNLLLRAFKNSGGLGLEVVTSNHTMDQMMLMARLCHQFDLHASIGSDFHGPSSWAKLGVMPKLPTECKAIWDVFPHDTFFLDTPR